MNDTITCIICPRGCRMKVGAPATPGGDPVITANHCVRGISYAKSEFTNPVRTVTTTVRLRGGAIPVAPVKTDRPVPKGLIRECMAIINRLEPVAPVRIGQVLAEDILGTGANIVITRNIDKDTGSKGENHV